MKALNMWTSPTRKLYRRLLGSKKTSDKLPSEVETLIDGATAVAVTEACIADAASLAQTFPADVAARAWESERSREGANGFGRPLTSAFSGDARGALAAAIGASLSGLRTSAFVSGPDLARAKDHLRLATRRHLPLLLHVGSRASAGPATARGSGHEEYHGVSDCGCMQFFARNVQQAVDFTLVARRAAELALLPAVLAMDVEQTALAAQEAHLPLPELVRELLGSPRDLIETPSPAQKLLFGPERRRVPASYDLDHPLLLGGFQGPEAWALGAVGQRPFFDRHVTELVEQSLRELENRTGRRQELVSSFLTEDAPWILLAQGSAVETAEALARWLREERRQRIGVIGIHCSRPFPAATVLELIRGKVGLAVLERVTSPVGAEPPLLSEIRSAVGRALDNGRFGSETHPDCPTWTDKDIPRLRSVFYGLGGYALRAADLIALCSELDSRRRRAVYLGIELAPLSSPYPKRQALFDQIHRAYPDVKELGLRSKDRSPDMRPEGSLTVGVHRKTGEGYTNLSREAASLLHRVTGGHVRSRPSSRWERFAEPVADIFTYSAEPLKDPGDDVSEDIAVVAAARPGVFGLSSSAVRPGGELLFLDGGGVSGGRDDVQAFTVEDGELREERLLGALAARLAERLGLKPKKILAERGRMLSELPEEEREARLAAFEAGLKGLQPASGPAAVASPPPITRESELPMAVRRLGTSATPLESVPRFWDQVGVLYHSEETKDLAADPCQTAGAVPPLTSTFRDFSTARATLPALDPRQCTGCGACWTWCPEGAVAPLALGPAALLEAGIGMARVDALRPMVSQLAQRLAREIKAEPAPRKVGEALDAAFQWLAGKMPLPDERRKAFQEAHRQLLDAIGDLPLARTAPFFDEEEARAKGAGQILSLAINPDACKACGICVSVCEPGALEEEPQDTSRLDAARRRWRLWERLPEPPGDTIDRVREHPSVGPTAAMLLSRSCLMAMAGGDGAEAGSGEKIALRLVLASVEYHVQPRLRHLLRQIDERREQLEAKIRERIADALPLSDLDTLAETVDRWEGEGDTARLPAPGRIDAKRLRAQVETAQHLADTAWRLGEGVGGMGRCRVGLAVAGDARSSWLGAFPDNPFSMPVVIDPSGDTAELARGLVEGQLQAATEAFIALGRADLELHRPEEAARESARLDRLTWRDLSAEERKMLPPLLLVGSDEALAGRGLFELLETDLPIKVLALSDLGLRPDGGSSFDLGFTALALRKAFVAQTSIAEPEHFYRCLRDGLAFAGPALLHVHAPRPARHGFEMNRTVEQAALAVRSRAFVLFRYDPSGEGVFGLHLDLEGNPEPEKTWVHDLSKGPLTPAHWAASELRFTRHIRSLDANAAAPTALSDYLLMTRGERRGKTPFFTRDGESRWTLTPEMLQWLDERVTLWRALQELAGIVTPFTEKIRTEAQEVVAQTHQAELQSLRKEYESKIQSLGEAKQAEIAERIRNQLLVLTGYKR